MHLPGRRRRPARQLTPAQTELLDALDEHAYLFEKQDRAQHRPALIAAVKRALSEAGAGDLAVLAPISYRSADVPTLATAISREIARRASRGPR